MLRSWTVRRLPAASPEDLPPARLTGTAGARSAPAISAFLGSRFTVLPLAIGAVSGAYVSAVLWQAHQPSNAVVALGLATIGGAALLAGRSQFWQVLGYLLGLVSASMGVLVDAQAVLAYAPWTMLGAMIFVNWRAFLGVCLAGVFGYAGAWWADGRSGITPVVLAAAGVIALVHLGAIVLAREVRARAQLALTDPLTGVANRRMLLWALADELARLKRSGATLALVYLDVDGFKHVNDTFGHHAADRALIQIAQALERSVQPHDLVARVGGDEFVLLLRGHGEAETAKVAGQLQAALSRARLPLPLGLSIGWVIAPHDGTTTDALFDLVASGLFERKHKSRAGSRSLTGEVITALRALPEGAQQLVHLLDAEEVELEEHVAQVGQWSLELAQRVGLEPARRRVLAQAALLHDIGKLAVPRALLRSQRPLTSDERAMVQQHVAKGCAILRTLEVDDAVVKIVAAHHERWDGKGYPGETAETAIPLEARILAIADSYDAMTAVRGYNRPVSSGSATDELRREAGRQFDPRLVQCFIELLPQQTRQQSPVQPAALYSRAELPLG